MVMVFSSSVQSTVSILSITGGTEITISISLEAVQNKFVQYVFVAVTVKLVIPGCDTETLESVDPFDHEYVVVGRLFPEASTRTGEVSHFK